jgi:arsenate reductase
MTAMRLCLLVAIIPFLHTFRLFAQQDPTPGNPVSTALWFTHQFALPGTLTPGKDRDLKIKIITTLGRSPELTRAAAGDLFEKAAFEKLARGDTITVATMDKLLKETMPQSRKNLNAKTRLHAQLLTTQFDLIEESHRAPAEQLVAWIVRNYQPGQSLGVIIICTGNTRRSMLGATMGNIAAAYYGLDIRFASGGTAPDAFNSRAIATLKEIGVDIEPTGQEAPPGTAGRANPIYRLQWGKGLETLEYSKKYTDARNPKEGFAAMLVCSEADASCPKVTGASIRIPVPYLDPKAFDGAPFEAAKYAERRDDIGRFMLCTMMQARRQLEIAGKLK